MLTATFEQRPPVNNGKTNSGQAKFDTKVDWNTSTDWQGDLWKCRKSWKEKMPKIENSTLVNNAETKKRLHTKVSKMLSQDFKYNKTLKIWSFRYVKG